MHSSNDATKMSPIRGFEADKYLTVDPQEWDAMTLKEWQEKNISSKEVLVSF
jgi:hypothetical protein